MIDRQPCGCKADENKWLELCQTHRAEHDARHIQAAADKRAAEAQKRFQELL